MMEPTAAHSLSDASSLISSQCLIVNARICGGLISSVTEIWPKIGCLVLETAAINGAGRFNSFVILIVLIYLSRELLINERRPCPVVRFISREGFVLPLLYNPVNRMSQPCDIPPVSA